MSDFQRLQATKCYLLDCNDENKSAKDLSAKIDKDFPPKNKGNDFNVLYIYSLVENEVEYPCNKSNVLYIGHTYGQIQNKKKSLGFRFKHCLNGSDNKQNICLLKYYDSGYKIKLELFEITGSKDASKIESSLRYSFLNSYGALPVADGASFKKNKKSNGKLLKKYGL